MGFSPDLFYQVPKLGVRQKCGARTFFALFEIHLELFRSAFKAFFMRVKKKKKHHTHQELNHLRITSHSLEKHFKSHSQMKLYTYIYIFLEVSTPDVGVSPTSVYELPGCQFNDPRLLRHQQRPMRRTDTKECSSLPGSQLISLGPLYSNAGLVCQLPSCHRGQNVPRQTQWAYCARDETAVKP